MRQRTKNRISTALLIVILLSLTLGFAYLNTSLNINGVADVDSNTWNVYWDNVQVSSGSVEADTPVIDTNQTSVSFQVHLSKPGDFYEFTVDAKNDGSIDAMVESISSKLNDSEITTLPDYLEYSVTYEDGREIYPKQKLSSSSKETYRIHVGYKKDITSNQLPATAQSLSLSFATEYEQADSTAQTRLFYYVKSEFIDEDAYTTETEPTQGDYIAISQGNGEIVRLDYVTHLDNLSTIKKFTLIGYDSGKHYQENIKTLEEMCSHISGTAGHNDDYAYCEKNNIDLYKAKSQGELRAITQFTDCSVNLDGSYHCMGMLD